MSPRVVENMLVVCCGAIAFWPVVGAQAQFFNSQEPSLESITAKFFGACVSRQKHSASNRQFHFTALQIDTYCRCYATSLTALTTVEERRGLAMEADAPPDFQFKVQEAANQCIHTIEKGP